MFQVHEQIQEMCDPNHFQLTKKIGKLEKLACKKQHPMEKWMNKTFSMSMQYFHTTLDFFQNKSFFCKKKMPWF